MHSLGLINNHFKATHYHSCRSLAPSYSSNPTLHFADVGTTVKKGARVKINVGGNEYETYESTLDKYPETLLGTAGKRNRFIDHNTGVIFLDRYRGSFGAVLYFYQSSGNLVRPSGMLMSDFVKECEFYELSDGAIRRMKHRECFLHRKKKEIPTSLSYNTFKSKCYIFFEKPEEFGHILSLIYFYFMYSLIIFSIVLYCSHSEVFLHMKGSELTDFLFIHGYIEVALYFAFTLELSVRFLVSPFRKEFLLKPINFIEMISVTTFVLVYGFPEGTPRRSILDFSRILCTFRITRLGRVSKVVKISLTVFQEAIDDVLAVLYTLVILMILGGTVMYYIELNVPGTQFTSIPESMWWAMQTSLCLGYGDIIPQTFVGRYLGLLVLYGGVVVVMVLILSLGGRVFDMYIKEFDETGGFLPDLSIEDFEIHYQDPLYE